MDRYLGFTYKVGDWLSIDAGMDMGVCKVIRIVHEDRWSRAYILVDFLINKCKKKRIKIKHGDIMTKFEDGEKIKELEARLESAKMAYDIEKEEEEKRRQKYR